MMDRREVFPFRAPVGLAEHELEVTERVTNALRHWIAAVNDSNLLELHSEVKVSVTDEVYFDILPHLANPPEVEVYAADHTDEPLFSGQVVVPFSVYELCLTYSKDEAGGNHYRANGQLGENNDYNVVFDYDPQQFDFMVRQPSPQSPREIREAKLRRWLLSTSTKTVPPTFEIT